MKNKWKYFALMTAGLILCGTQSGYAKNVDELVDSATANVKEAIAKMGNDVKALQDYLNHYSWKGIIQDTASSDVATLSHFQLNDHGRVVVASPGQKLNGEVICAFDKSHCNSTDYYRVAIGIKGLGAQTTIGNVWGSNASKSLEQFELTAPNEPGLYQVRFRTVKALLETSALSAWTDSGNHEPDGSTTIGLILIR